MSIINIDKYLFIFNKFHLIVSCEREVEMQKKNVVSIYINLQIMK